MLRAQMHRLLKSLTAGLLTASVALLSGACGSDDDEDSAETRLGTCFILCGGEDGVYGCYSDYGMTEEKCRASAETQSCVGNSGGVGNTAVQQDCECPFIVAQPEPGECTSPPPWYGD
jgi:hypothetical protein